MKQTQCEDYAAAITEATASQGSLKTSDLPTTDASCLKNEAAHVRQKAELIRMSRIKWKGPKTIILITKPGDAELVGMTRELALWLISAPNENTVYVDKKLEKVRSFKHKKIIELHPHAATRLDFWTPKLCAEQPHIFDFIITLGGDGTVLFSSWMFQNIVPAVIPFNLGSLGFLTPFDFDHYKEHLSQMFENGVHVNLRGRLTCTVYRRMYTDYTTSDETSPVKLRNIKRNLTTGKITVGGWCSSGKAAVDEWCSAAAKKTKKKFGEVDGEDFDDTICEEMTDSEEELDEPTEPVRQEHRQVPFFTTYPAESFQVINELVVDRGPNPTVSMLELFGDDGHLTTVQADGLAIATPTGSTAYSLSANGSLTHPQIHATLITPICPHTLSFRPTLVPDSMVLRVSVPFNSRTTAWASFDGRGRVELKQGDHIKITASKHPFATVCKKDPAKDWFNSLQKCLHWNKRQRQKSFAIEESNTRSSVRSSHRSSTNLGAMSTRGSSTSLKASGSGGSSPPTPTRKAAPVPSTTSSGSSDAARDDVFGMFSDWKLREDYDGRDSSSTNTSQESPERQDEYATDSEDEKEEGLIDEFIPWSDDEILISQKWKI